MFSLAHSRVLRYQQIQWDYTPNDQVHRAGGPTRVNVEQPKNVNEGNDIEKPKREPAPVQRLVM